MAENKDWKSPAQMYINDIQVIDVVYQLTMYSLGILDTGLVGMNCHTNTIQEILWPKRTSRRYGNNARQEWK